MSVRARDAEQRYGEWLAARNGVSVDDALIHARQLRPRLREPGAAMTKPIGSDLKGYCSFCGKSQHEVRKLIAGPTVFICNECVELCAGIIRDEPKA